MWVCCVCIGFFAVGCSVLVVGVLLCGGHAGTLSVACWIVRVVCICTIVCIYYHYFLTLLFSIFCWVLGFATVQIFPEFYLGDLASHGCLLGGCPAQFLAHVALCLLTYSGRLLPIA